MTLLTSRLTPKLLCVFFILIVFAGAEGSFARTITPEEVEAYFVRYSGIGKSDVELTISVVIQDEFAFVSQSDDGVYRSFVSLNGIPPAFKIPNERIEELALRWVYIHETTHGFVVPYLNPAFPSRNDSFDTWAAFGFQALANESAADARVIIELWRKDGAAVAEEFARHLIAFRDQAPGDTVHQTQQAINDALTALRQDPQRQLTDHEAFRMALDIGMLSAIATGRHLVEKYEGTEKAKEILDSSVVRNAINEIRVAFDRAVSANANGRFLNNAVTIRFSEGPNMSTEKDYHVYVDRRGVITREPVYGAEGAREKREIIELMISPSGPVEFFAGETVKRLGRITKDQYRDTVIVYDRFLRTFAGNDPVKRARAFGIMATTIATIDRRVPLGAAYSEVNRRLMFELGYSK
jgi:hypothetical protein